MTSRAAGLPLAVGAAGLAAHLAPSVAAIGPLRRAVLPGLCGVSPAAHVALTFDDGPDPASTPRILDGLAAHDVRATFFVLGSQLAAHPDLGRRIAAEGHELAVHGWTHRPHLLRTPAATARDLRRGHDCVASVSGARPRWWRPPHGIPTGAGLLAARRLHLRPVLWTADGRDWRADATAQSVLDRITPRLRAGAVVLLHDSDVVSAPGSWRATLAALPRLLAACTRLGLAVGPLAEHGLGPSAQRARSAASRAAR
jgi:peptidoglycan/xylan/chitin deacetylase (PgdA/CDA1 family)